MCHACDINGPESHGNDGVVIFAPTAAQPRCGCQAAEDSRELAVTNGMFDGDLSLSHHTDYNTSSKYFWSFTRIDQWTYQEQRLAQFQIAFAMDTPRFDAFSYGCSQTLI